MKIYDSKSKRTICSGSLFELSDYIVTAGPRRIMAQFHTPGAEGKRYMLCNDNGGECAREQVETFFTVLDVFVGGQRATSTILPVVEKKAAASDWKREKCSRQWQRNATEKGHIESRNEMRREAVLSIDALRMELKHSFPYLFKRTHQKA